MVVLMKKQIISIVTIDAKDGYCELGCNFNVAGHHCDLFNVRLYHDTHVKKDIQCNDCLHSKQPEPVEPNRVLMLEGW